MSNYYTYDTAGFHSILVYVIQSVGEMGQVRPHLLHIQQVTVGVHVLQSVRIQLLKLIERTQC